MTTVELDAPLLNFRRSCLLPRVPCVGESVQIGDHALRVTAVVWFVAPRQTESPICDLVRVVLGR